MRHAFVFMASQSVSSTPARSFVALRNVVKQYPMGTSAVRALDDISLTISEGEFVAVVGPSGSGKSTLLALLAAMDRPTAGAVRVGEWALHEMDTDAQSQYRRAMVGIIFQQFHLIPTMTALENVALPMVLAGRNPRERTERAQACLRAVGLMNRATHRPVELSGGEQQRVAMARALVQEPPLLLADEPTGNLDSETGAQIIHLLADLHRDGRTVVVVTHHPAEVEHVAQRVIRLRDGRRADA